MKSAATNRMELRPQRVPLASLTRTRHRFVKRVRGQQPAGPYRAGFAGKRWP